MNVTLGVDFRSDQVQRLSGYDRPQQRVIDITPTAANSAAPSRRFSTIAGLLPQSPETPVPLDLYDGGGATSQRRYFPGSIINLRA